jgi:type IV secretory pathway VirB2 component (pilin)
LPVLSVFVPLLSLSWAAAVVRFDYFIHRQGAYLRAVESGMGEAGVSIPLWETWKSSLRSTALVVPVADVIAVLVIVVPTAYLLFGPAQEFFRERGWRWGRAYAWSAAAVLGLLLGLLPFIPRIAGM